MLCANESEILLSLQDKYSRLIRKTKIFLRYLNSEDLHYLSTCIPTYQKYLKKKKNSVDLLTNLKLHVCYLPVIHPSTVYYFSLFY